MAKFSIIGAGAFGSSLAIYCNKIGHDVKVWAFEKDLPEIVKEKGENEPFLPGIKMDPAIEFSNDMEYSVKGCDLPLRYLNSTFQKTRLLYLPPKVSRTARYV